MIILSLLVLLIALVPTTLFAFPDHVRHGYTNCTTCHYSPSGGGLLNNYGRELSRDLLSTWGAEGREVKPFYGILKNPEWLPLGGDVRVLQLYRDTPYFREEVFIPMQFDLEVGVITKSVSAITSLGLIPKRVAGQTEYSFGSRKHYLLFTPAFSPLTHLRLGKFYPAFGINVPDHTISTRRNLQFDEGYESYNLEFSFIGQKYNFFTTAILGRKETKVINNEKGAALSVYYSFLERYKVGGSYLYASSKQNSRTIIGTSAILGLTKDIYLLTEVDYQKVKGKIKLVTPKWERYLYSKIGYEVYKGVHLYLSYDKAESILSKGAGILFYPRPHYELSLAWFKQSNPQISSASSDMGTLMLHLYF